MVGFRSKYLQTGLYCEGNHMPIAVQVLPDKKHHLTFPTKKDQYFMLVKITFLMRTSSHKSFFPDPFRATNKNPQGMFLC